VRPATTPAELAALAAPGQAVLQGPPRTRPRWPTANAFPVSA